MSFVPSIILYASNGSTPVYTFEHVLDLPDWPTDNPSSVILENLRSQGAIVIPGGDKSYIFRIRGVLTSDSYTNLMTAINALKDAIVNNTNYVLKIQTSVSATDDINVKRITPILWEGPARKTKVQYYVIEFLAESW